MANVGWLNKGNVSASNATQQHSVEIHTAPAISKDKSIVTTRNTAGLGNTATKSFVNNSNVPEASSGPSPIS